jgi:hypothetical protein
MPTHPHGLVHPLKTVLIDFLDELKALETSGLNSQQCNTVQQSLRNIIDDLRKSPTNSVWLHDLKAHLDKFLTEYVLWNNSDMEVGSAPPKHRARHERELRRIRKQMMLQTEYGPYS